jgi:hypothetical protein
VRTSVALVGLLLGSFFLLLEVSFVILSHLIALLDGELRELI